jgi:hypothetical protein
MYAGGQGRLLVKAASLWPVVDASGEQMNQGEMILYLNEMMWFPAALLAGARSVIGSSRSSRCLRCSRRPRRSRCKAGEGLGSLGRVDFGKSCRCFGADVGVELVVSHDAAQGLGGQGLIDLGQSCRRLKAHVGVELVVGHDAAQGLGAPSWVVFGQS